MATPTVPGVITDDGRSALAKSFGHAGGFVLSFGSYFKIGTGGFTPTVGGNAPKAPNPGLHDIEASTSGMYYFRKSFATTDITFIPPSIIQFRCRLQPGESNDDGTGSEPKFFEVGIFDVNNVMVGYATFDEQTKNISKTITEFVQLYF